MIEFIKANKCHYLGCLQPLWAVSFLVRRSVSAFAASKRPRSGGVISGYLAFYVLNHSTK